MEINRMNRIILNTNPLRRFCGNTQTHIYTQLLFLRHNFSIVVRSIMKMIALRSSFFFFLLANQCLSLSFSLATRFCHVCVSFSVHRPTLMHSTLLVYHLCMVIIVGNWYYRVFRFVCHFRIYHDCCCCCCGYFFDGFFTYL